LKISFQSNVFFFFNFVIVFSIDIQQIRLGIQSQSYNEIFAFCWRKNIYKRLCDIYVGIRL